MLLQWEVFIFSSPNFLLINHLGPLYMPSVCSFSWHCTWRLHRRWDIWKRRQPLQLPSRSWATSKPSPPSQRQYSSSRPTSLALYTMCHQEIWGWNLSKPSKYRILRIAFSNGRGFWWKWHWQWGAMAINGFGSREECGEQYCRACRVPPSSWEVEIFDDINNHLHILFIPLFWFFLTGCTW